MSPAQHLVAVLGRGVVDPDAPILSADDLGATRGDGIFEVTRVVTTEGVSRVDHLDRHLARFRTSAARLALPAPDADAWQSLVHEAVAAWHVPGEAALKLVWTRGRENVPSGPTGYLTLTAQDPAALAASRAGITVASIPRGYASDAFGDAPWLLGGVKSLSYGVNLAARRAAAERGAEEALFVSTDGYALEGPTAGLIVARDDELITSPTGATGVLPSITVAVVTEAAEAAGVRVRRALLRPADLPHSQGAWFASSVKGVVPIVSLDGVPVPHDPEITRTLVAAAGFDR
ncbi:MAG TPA: aminodeoxychorismate lyase [Propionibacteriaceae bacterium]|uniref:aminodeoxychorismate lyase n=1 Tax=Dietzia sp. UBA5065 TaxID=1946422 RepID=UPI000E9B5013|nr:aminodeoxychorismate lyase [Dietzia sp. UBA5065]MBK9157088.1 aminodeoxychorismate lyase [Micropruina sp.]HBX80336.1 aminodeoxychorismate lyase [Propionibacteriaceae bacterium]HBY23900.1 aminodeoxychorismate lyase [Propionibacteriaceae bacterium]